MPDIVRMTTELELESIAVETFINTTDKVTKVTDHSVVRGMIRGNVKTAKKALKDVKLAVSHLFIDDATGPALDEVADSLGISPRFTASQSSTYIRLIGNAGTVYQAGINTVSDNKGNVFDLESNLTLGSKGFGYVKVRSQQSGSSKNVAPYTVINITPAPSGHIGLINEYAATGGVDFEVDDIFKQRIKRGADILAKSTLDSLTEAFIKINPNVLRVIYEGINQQGKVVISILTTNGIDLTSDELSSILEGSSGYLAICDMSPIGYKSYGVILKNVEYFPIDVSMRIGLFTGVSFDDVVKDIQQKFAKYVDFRFWNSSIDKVQWDDLLGIVKGVSGVKYVPDAYFSPLVDITVPRNKFPRFRGFQAYDLNGSLMINQAGTLDPIFYPTPVNNEFQLTIL